MQTIDQQLIGQRTIGLSTIDQWTTGQWLFFWGVRKLAGGPELDWSCCHFIWLLLVIIKDRKCAENQNSSLHTEICRDKTSNNCPLSKEEFWIFSHTQNSAEDKNRASTQSNGSQSECNRIWQHPCLQSSHKNKSRFLWNKVAGLYNSNKYLLLGICT